MEAKASLNGVRISPQKMRLVANEVRGYEFLEAVDFFKHMPQNSAREIRKTLLSAGANAKVVSPDVAEADLYIKKIFVDEGPRWKRFRPRARGGVGPRLRRTSKLTVVIGDETD